jgi:hypothetical protein
MIKTFIVFPDGTELSSGVNSVNAIQSFSMTECVNAGEELTIGSVCCNSIEVKVFTPSGEFSVEAGTEVTVYRQDEIGRHKVGVFILDKPSRVTANTMKIVGYDRVSKLDKDLTAWFAELVEWPAEPFELATWICYQCGIGFKANGNHPNDFYRIEKFTKSPVTGRKLMKWLAEICGCFCRANADGNIEFAWYKDNGAEIAATGENYYYFQNGLSYDDFVTAPIEAVQIRLADSENGVPWPLAEEGINSYIITGNPMMPNSISDPLLSDILLAIKQRLEKVSYTPCKVSIPARMDIHAGDIVHITDKNGKRITCYVMTKTQKGLKDTLECVGSKRRDSTQAMNDKAQKDFEDQAAQKEVADQAAQNVLRAQTGEEIFNKLTNDGEIQGIYQKDGKWYINGEFAQVFNLVADYITSGKLQSKDGRTYFNLDSGEIATIDTSGYSTILSSGAITCLDTDKNVSAGLYAAGKNHGLIRLGKCSIVGDSECMRVTTRNEDLQQLTIYKAVWKEITYVDHQGESHTETILVAR